MKNPKLGASWRDSARPSKLWIVDSSAVFPIVIMFFKINWYTFGTAVTFIIFLSILSYYGFTIRVFIRYLRSKIAGKRKIAVPWWLA